MTRTLPSPSLFPQSQAQAKVILGGEHSVVYGGPALVAGIPQGLQLQAQALPDPRAPLRVEIPEWELDLELLPDSDNPVSRAILEVLGHCDAPLWGWKICGQSSIPARAGLGSSAALTVAMARLALGPQASLAQLRQASLAGETIFHGQPSGLDTECSIRGGLWRFTPASSTSDTLNKEESKPEPRLREIQRSQELALWIVPTGITRQTSQLVQHVRDKWQRLPRLQSPLLAAMNACVEEMQIALETDNAAQLGELMNLNHELLSALGVSSPALDAICNHARSLGALGAKLTGAGRGGCAIVYAPQELSWQKDLHEIAQRHCKHAPAPFLVRIPALKP